MKFDMQERVNRIPPGLVIFDCDGVLVDSEMLSAGVLMAMMAEVGFPITEDIFRHDFLGRSFASAATRTLERFGSPMPADFQIRYRTRLLQKLRGNLQRMAGVESVLAGLRVPFCLATSSSPERLAVTMSETGLGKWFEGRSFTASLVTNGKPAPDLFLLATSKMGFTPDQCVVIEDSEIGVRAGIAANMEVWHFTGGSHMKAGISLPEVVKPHRVLDSMAGVHQAFCEMGISQD